MAIHCRRYALHLRLSLHHLGLRLGINSILHISSSMGSRVFEALGSSSFFITFSLTNYNLQTAGYFPHDGFSLRLLCAYLLFVYQISVSLCMYAFRLHLLCRFLSSVITLDIYSYAILGYFSC
ncbi:hypothetical protein R6Q59_023832 [Mikania micrantha]